MQDNIMSFSTKVKKEMLLKKPCNDTQIISELYGIFVSKGGIINKRVNFKTEISYIVKRVIENLKKLEITDFKLDIIRSEKYNIYTIMLDDFKIMDNIDEIWFLRGIFLVNGYIKDPVKGYSIDFFIKDESVAKKTYDILESFDKKVFLSRKNNENIVYIRNSEDILDLLITFDAVNIFFEYQNTTINKEINLKITRNMNYELANETKKMMTSQDQIKMIKFIDEKLGIRNLNNALQEVALIRLENEDSSLLELAEKLKITKSGIRNRFRRLKEIYEKLDRENE